MSKTAEQKAVGVALALRQAVVSQLGRASLCEATGEGSAEFDQVYGATVLIYCAELQAEATLSALSR